MHKSSQPGVWGILQWVLAWLPYTVGRGRAKSTAERKKKTTEVMTQQPEVPLTEQGTQVSETQGREWEHGPKHQTQAFDMDL